MGSIDERQVATTTLLPVKPAPGTDSFAFEESEPSEIRFGYFIRDQNSSFNENCIILGEFAVVIKPNVLVA
jgi:hypothetical protein